MATRQRTLVSQTKAARFFSLTSRTIRYWIEEGAPVEGEGRGAQICLEDLIAWRREKDRDEVKTDEDLDLKTEKAALTRAQRMKAEVELAEMLGKLMPIAQWKELDAYRLGTLRGKLLNVPGRYAPLFAGKHTARQAESLLDNMVREFLEELASQFGVNGHGNGNGSAGPKPRRIRHSRGQR